MTLRGMLQHMERAGAFVENTLLIALLSVMILLATSQIFLRNVFDAGFVWGDEFLRILVLWLAMAGAVAASRADKHITIDVLSRFFPARAGFFVKAVVNVFTAGVCGVAAWYAGAFVAMEKEFASTILGDVPAWPFQIVIPLGFGLISYRYVIHAVKNVMSAFAGEGEVGAS